MKNSFKKTGMFYYYFFLKKKSAVGKKMNGVGVV